MTTVQGEALGDSGTNVSSEMAFSIEKHTVTVSNKSSQGRIYYGTCSRLKSNSWFRC